MDFDYDAVLGESLQVLVSPKHQEFVDRLIAAGVLPPGSEVVVRPGGGLGLRHGGGKIFEMTIDRGGFGQEVFRVSIPIMIERPAERVAVNITV